MCLTLCLRRGILYDSDTDDVCAVCEWNLGEDGETCRSCRWCRGKTCLLTRAPIPRSEWCCHASVQCPITGLAGFREGDLRGVRLARYGLPGAFEVYGVEYEGPRPDGSYLVDVAELSVPVTYGVASVHWCDVVVDEDPLEWDPDAVLAEGEFVSWL